MMPTTHKTTKPTIRKDAKATMSLTIAYTTLLRQSVSFSCRFLTDRFFCLFFAASYQIHDNSLLLGIMIVVNAHSAGFAFTFFFGHWHCARTNNFPALVILIHTNQTSLLIALLLITIRYITTDERSGFDGQQRRQ
jgi:hypothetical protein